MLSSHTERVVPETDFIVNRSVPLELPPPLARCNVYTMHPGPKIRQIREEKGITIEEVCLSTGINNGNLSKLERGMLGYSPLTLQKIAERLGVEIYEFFIDLDSQAISIARAYAVMRDEDRLKVQDLILRSRLGSQSVARTVAERDSGQQQQPRAVVRRIKRRRGEKRD
jgi:transcriptional regulator with XRE-family HTH domain